MSTRRHESHVQLDPLKLMRELRRRGLSAATFAAAAGLSTSTMSGVLQHGKPIQPRTARRIAGALVRIAPVEGLDAIMADLATDAAEAA